MKRRRQQVLLLGACTTLGPLALNIHLAALPLMQHDLDTDVAGVQSTVSVALLGFGAGLLLLGSLADRFGRRSCLLAGLAAYVCGSAIATLAPHLIGLNLGRFVLAAGAALVFICARGVVADRSPPEELASSIAQVTVINVITLSFSPLLGNLLISIGGWRLTQAVGVVLGLVIAAVVYWRQPETLSLGSRRRAATAGWDTTAPLRALVAQAPFRNLMMQVGLLYCSYPAFVATAPHLMVDAFARPVTQFAWYFAFLPMGYLLGNLYVMRFAVKRDRSALIRQGMGIALGSCLLSAVLLLLGAWHPLALFVPAGLMLNFGLGLALPAISARAVLGAGDQVSSAWALIGCSQQVLGAIAVQALGYTRGDSPYPVLALSVGVLLVAAALERRTAPRRQSM